MAIVKENKCQGTCGHEDHAAGEGKFEAEKIHGKPGDELWVEVYYQREMHWNRTMAKAIVVDKPFWFPPRRGATPPGPY